MSELANLQRWLTSIIIKPGMLKDKIHLADQTYKLDNRAVIRSSVSMSSGQKIGIYARGYVLRLMECMEAEYPAVQYLLGDNLFNTFAKAYLLQVPSTSPDLYDLGKNFPAFLKASQPKGADDASIFDLPVELATLERTLAETSRSKGLEGQENNSVIDDQMLFLFGTANFHTSPCLTLLELQFPLVDFVKAVQHGEAADTPEKKQSYLAISRKNYTVNMHGLEAWQWYFLQSLQITDDYMQAVEAASQASAIPQDTVMADLMLWLPVALSFGYIYRA
jgi:hypothetical protein